MLNGNCFMMKLFNMGQAEFYFEYTDLKHYGYDADGKSMFNHGLLINTKYSRSQDQDNYCFHITRYGDLLAGIVIDPAKLKYVNYIRLEIGGTTIAILDKYSIKGAIKKVKVTDTINKEDELVSVISLLNIPIPIVSLAYHSVDIIINSTTKPLKYLDVVYYFLDSSERMHLASSKWYFYYMLSNKQTIPVIVKSGMAGGKDYNEPVVNSLYADCIDKIIYMQRIWKAKMKLKKLKLFGELKEKADMILYRPNNLGFLDLMKKYTGVFQDC